MKWIVIIWMFLSVQVFAQSLSYIPGITVSKTIETSYYDTEYIHFTYEGSDTVLLNFQLIQDTASKGWSRTLCTNLICYASMPEEGVLGDFSNGDQGYMALSLSTGDEIGEGTFKYRIFSTNSDAIDDTVSFHYEILDSEAIINQPWVKVNTQQNVVFVLFKNSFLTSTFELFDLSGHLLVTTEVSGTYTYSLADLEKGIYIVRIKSESGQEHVQRILKF